MAGLDPAIQRRLSLVRMTKSWMAALRAAMTK
jgi:hypothetical protein